MGHRSQVGFASGFLYSKLCSLFSIAPTSIINSPVSDGLSVDSTVYSRPSVVVNDHFARSRPDVNLASVACQQGPAPLARTLEISLKLAQPGHKVLVILY